MFKETIEANPDMGPMEVARVLAKRVPDQVTRDAMLALVDALDHVIHHGPESAMERAPREDAMRAAFPAAPDTIAPPPPVPEGSAV